MPFDTLSSADSKTKLVTLTSQRSKRGAKRWETSQRPFDNPRGEAAFDIGMVVSLITQHNGGKIFGMTNRPSN
jgi:hypothetical protein